MPVFKREGRRYYQVDWAVDTYVSILGATREKSLNYNLRHFIIKRSGYIPLHRHTNVYHLQYMLKGRIKLRIGEETYIVGEGDVMYLPNGPPHGYLNIGDSDAEFLCITPLIPDKMEVVDKNKEAI